MREKIRIQQAVSTAAYVLNRCPTRALTDCTPEEAWTGEKPVVHHLRIYGSVCHMHIPAEKRKKLEDRSEALILVGYHSTGAYKLYNPKKKQIVISRDVVVDEAAKWNWEPVAVTVEKRHIPCLLEDKAAATTSSRVEITPTEGHIG